MKLRTSCAHPGLAFETIPAPGPWIKHAACAGEPTELFFPEDDVATERARSICSGCKVRAECIGYAVEIPSLDGIWGGLTRQERARLRQKKLWQPKTRRRSGGSCQVNGDFSFPQAWRQEAGDEGLPGSFRSRVGGQLDRRTAQ